MTLRVDLLKAKSVQAEVSCANDIRRLSEAKRDEQQLGIVAQGKERQFWNEAVKNLSASQANRGEAGPQSAALLDRMRQAHGELKDVQTRYQTSSQRAQQLATQLSNSSKQLELMQQLLAKANRRVSQRNEGRMSEDLMELAQSLKRASLSSRPSSTLTRAERGAATAHDTLAQVGRRESAENYRANQLTDSLMHVAPESLQKCESSSTRVTTPSPIMEVRQIECGTRPDGTELTIRCAVGPERSLLLSLIKGEGEGVKVVLNPSCSITAGAVAREKGAIQARLQALGLKISSLEVEATDSQSPALFRSRRNSSTTLGDDDEALVA